MTCAVFSVKHGVIVRRSEYRGRGTLLLLLKLLLLLLLLLLLWRGILLLKLGVLV